MLSRVSVSILLKSVIAALGAIIVVMLALSARESWTRLKTASQISNVANISSYMFTAMNSLRVDRSATIRDLVADRQLTAMNSLLKESRDIEMPALNGLMTALASAEIPDRDQIAAEFGSKLKRLKELHEQTAAQFLQPKSARPAGLSDEYNKEVLGLMDALDKHGTQLVKLISLKDPYVDQLMEIKQIAWAMRNAAGDASLVVSNTLGGDRKSVV